MRYTIALNAELMLRRARPPVKGVWLWHHGEASFGVDRFADPGFDEGVGRRRRTTAGPPLDAK
jgi:hypothetical protein